jgi:hypothetical protein
VLVLSVRVWDKLQAAWMVRQISASIVSDSTAIIDVPWSAEWSMPPGATVSAQTHDQESPIMPIIAIREFNVTEPWSPKLTVYPHMRVDKWDDDRHQLRLLMSTRLGGYTGTIDGYVQYRVGKTGEWKEDPIVWHISQGWGTPLTLPWDATHQYPDGAWIATYYGDSMEQGYDWIEDELQLVQPE